MNPSSNISWPAPPAKLDLKEGEIHVFAASLDVDPSTLSRLANILSPDETERAARFKFERHRNRYIAARGTLRTLLGRYLDLNPAEFRFAYSAHGKPAFEESAKYSNLHFNVAHSEDLALIAVTRLGSVGVDVEQIRPVKDVEELAKRFFSPRESEAFQKLDAAEKPAAFFNLWTRKEAMLKATGEGISGGLNRVEVTFLKNDPAQVLAIANDAAEARRWTLRELEPAAGFVGAVAIQASDIQVQMWKMTNDQ